MSKLLATKPLDQLLAESRSESSHGLVRALGPYNLISLGIGAVIGAGIFVFTGTAAAQFAGPAIMLSFALAGIGCAFAGLCYAEFAAMIPISGSAYTYGYATLGEIFAWIIGWDLVLEYGFSSATVASGWSGTIVSLLQDFGVNLPPQIIGTPGSELVFFQGRWTPPFNDFAHDQRGWNQSRQPAARDRRFQSARVHFDPDRYNHSGHRSQRVGAIQHGRGLHQSRPRSSSSLPLRARISGITLKCSGTTGASSYLKTKANSGFSDGRA